MSRQSIVIAQIDTQTNCTVADPGFPIGGAEVDPEISLRGSPMTRRTCGVAWWPSFFD